MAVEIFQITHNDFPTIKAITGLHEAYFIGHLGWEFSFSEDIGNYLGSFTTRLHSEGNGLWVAMSEQDIIGSIVIDRKDYGPESARLRLFIVDASYQNQGIGKRLMDHAVAFCKKNGYKKILLWTFKTLHAAKAVYLSHGFKIIDERKVDYWGKHLCEQLFGMDLNQVKTKECSEG